MTRKTPGSSTSNIFRIARRLRNSSDAFGKLIADGTTSNLDLTSAFRYSPESWRLYEEGTRVDLRYGDGDSLFRDERDVNVLTPGANNTLTFQTAKRLRYIVQYEAVWSQALQINRPLEADETVRVYFDGSKPADVFLEDAHGLEVTSDGAVLFINRNGTRIEEEPVELARPLTEWTLYQIPFNWYGVGPYEFNQSYTEDGEQINETVGVVSVEGDRPSRSPNGRITTEVETGASDDLEVEVGSAGFVIQGGQVTPRARQKSTVVEGLSHSGSGEYEPAFAFRVDPDNNLVTMQLTRVIPTDFDEDLEVNVIAAEPDLTDATGWETAPEQDSSASAMQVTEDITEFPDNDGDQVTSAAAPGGYQIGFATSNVEGQGAGRREAGIGIERQREIHDTDIAVVLIRSDVEDSDIRIEFDVTQEW